MARHGKPAIFGIDGVSAVKTMKLENSFVVEVIFTGRSPIGGKRQEAGVDLYFDNEMVHDPSLPLSASVLRRE